MDPETDAAPRRESPGCILGVGFALLLLFATLARLATMPVGATLDGAEDFREIFGEGGGIPGYRLADASRQPSGERVLRLLPVEGEGALPPGAPEEIVLFLFPSSRALRNTFQPPPLPFHFGGGGEPGPRGPGGASPDPGRRIAAWEADPSFAWHTTVEREEITWFKWRAAYAIERAMRVGGSWRESVRVNLDQVIDAGTKRHLLLSALWPENEHVDRGRLREILLAVKMLEEEPAGG